MSKRLLCIGVSEFDEKILMEQYAGADIEFIFFDKTLPDPRIIFRQEQIDARDYIKRAIYFAERLDRPCDGIIFRYDFPATLIAREIAEKLNLPGASLESVYKCENKAWSRAIQMEVSPKTTPDFWAINPHEAVPADLTFPVFVKPVKGWMSEHTCLVTSADELRRVMEGAKQYLSAYTRSFNDLIDPSFAPHGYEHVDGNYLIAEKVIGGKQLTLEGFVQNGEVHEIGIVDSHRMPNNFSFSRFQYPSSLPEDVQQRIRDISIKLIKATGLDHSVFNIEFFYDEERNKLHVIEINTRLASQFGYLYQNVDGADSTNKVMVEMALGNTAQAPYRQGPYAVSACFVLRTPTNSTVEALPTQEEMDALKARFPDLRIKLDVKVGDNLSASFYDGQTYRYAAVFISADTEQALHTKMAAIKERLNIKLRPLHQPKSLRQPRAAAGWHP
jgi:biotin carboxylase